MHIDVAPCELHDAVLGWLEDPVHVLRHVSESSPAADEHCLIFAYGYVAWLVPVAYVDRVGLICVDGCEQEGSC